TDLRTGPVLLDWYDVDSTKGTATIRGRFLFEGGTYSDDFTVAVDAASGTPHSFDIAPLPGRWYGDYISAGGFIASAPAQFHYVPLWVEPATSQVAYAHIVV